MPLCIDMRRGSSTLLIAFGGMASLVGVLPFELFKATTGIPVKRLFVRDLRQAWYHLGVPEHGDSVEAFAASLRELIARHQVRRLVVAGNSAGGYAALLFGALLGADVALCFAPQTVIDLDVLAGMDDHRYDKRLQELAETDALERRWLDLAEALPTLEYAGTRFETYFDDGFAADRTHAERIADVAGVRLHRRSGGKHSVALKLRASGELSRIMRDALLAEA